MTRVSENSSRFALNYSMGKAKSKLEDLQMKGSTLKRMARPSDDPVGNVDLLATRSKMVDNTQFLRNISFANSNLHFTETSLDELTEIMNKAKELALAQSSDFYNGDVRKGVANEVKQLRQQALSISNRRMGNRYIFGGHKTLSKPFEDNGDYNGDKNHTFVEISRDFFIPINLSGEEVFYDPVESKFERPIDHTKFNLQANEANNVLQRNIATSDLPEGTETRQGILSQLDLLSNALMSNSPEIIQALLEKIDDSVNQLINLRTQIGSVSSSVSSAEIALGKDQVRNSEFKSKIEDADVAELFSDIQRNQNILKATYKTGSKLINATLLDFVR